MMLIQRERMPSKIQWTDETWNPVTGCTKVSPGCAHCYAETLANRFWATQYPKMDEIPGHDTGRPRVFTDVQCHENRLDWPLRWRKPRRVFVNSMSDLFHEDVPDLFIERVFSVMVLAERHTFQVLTKRAARMRAWFAARRFDVKGYAILQTPLLGECLYANPWPAPNVWLGVSVENQHFADARFPIVCDLGESGWNTMVSMEPLLGPTRIPGRYLALGRRAWVILGGESGSGARPCDLSWIRSIRDQCQAAGVPCFVKQLGSSPCDGVLTREETRASIESGCGRPRPVGQPLSLDVVDEMMGEHRFRKWIKLKEYKNDDPLAWPSDLRIREYPS